MNDNHKQEDITEIVERLQDLQIEQSVLQIEQSVLLERLVGITGSDRPVANVIPRDNHQRPRAPPARLRGFRIGDRIRIINPNRLPASVGTLVNISEMRITVKPRFGINIYQVHHNIAFEE
jgi:hypothetical protein